MHRLMNNNIKTVAIAACAIALTGCAGFFDKDNTPIPTPLTAYKAEVMPQRMWSMSVNGGSDEFLKLSPAFTETAIYTTSVKGTVSSINKANGRINWQMNTGLDNTTGPGVGDGLVVVGARHGEVVALDEASGRQRWRTAVPGGILANPVVNASTVIVKTIDGAVRGLSADTGVVRWTYKQLEPNLILRGASTPLLHDGSAIVGFENGTLAKLNANTGQLSWAQPIAIAEGGFAIQRMIDIDANPIMFNNQLYAATYQGKIASLDWGTGRILWSHDISTYTGMIADGETVYVSDATGHLWAFDANSGLVNWRQTDLEARLITGPATLARFVIVGDAEGYLHWMSKQDGHFLGRTKVGSGGFYAAPVVENNVLYALTKKGTLVAYSL